MAYGLPIIVPATYTARMPKAGERQRDQQQYRVYRPTLPQVRGLGSLRLLASEGPSLVLRRSCRGQGATTTRQPGRPTARSAARRGARRATAYSPNGGAPSPAKLSAVQARQIVRHYRDRDHLGQQSRSAPLRRTSPTRARASAASRPLPEHLPRRDHRSGRRRGCRRRNPEQHGLQVPQAARRRRRRRAPANFGETQPKVRYGPRTASRSAAAATRSAGADDGGLLHPIHDPGPRTTSQ